MTPAELRSRCRVAESCLPKSEYRNRLTILHEDMLTIIEQQPNLNCPSVQARLATAWGYVKECEHDWKYVGSKGQIAFQCSKCGDYSFEAPVQEGWDD